MNKFSWFILLFSLFFLLIMWTKEITIETQFIPPVLNGITSSTSLFIGFIGTLVAVGVSTGGLKITQHKKQITFTLSSLSIAIMILFFAYFAVIIEEYLGALKLAMTALVISLFLLMNFLDFLTSMLEEPSS